MKKYAFLTVLVAVFLLGVCGAALADDVSIVINGTRMTSDVPPQVIDGWTLVPLRFISQALGAQVGWDAGTQTAIVRKGFTTNLPVDVPVNRINDQRLKLEVNGKLVEGVPLVVVDDRVMVPLRIISETFGADVRWDGETRTVVITVPDTGGAGSNDPHKEQSLKLMSEGLTKLQDSNEYSLDVNSTVRVEANVEEEHIRAAFEIRGISAFRKPGEAYAKCEVNLSDFQAPDLGPGAEVEPVVRKAVVEMYAKGDKVYMKINDGQWEPVPVDRIPYLSNLGGAAGSPDLSGSGNAAEKLSSLQHIVTVLSGPGVQFAPIREVHESGKNYLVVSGSAGGYDLFRFLSNGEMVEEVTGKILQNLLKDVRATFEYWIDKNSMVLSRSKGGASGTVKVPIMEGSEEDGEATMSVEIQVEGNYRTEIPFQMPVVE